MDRADLSDLASLDDDRIPLAESALRIALVEYPDLDVGRWVGEIDRLAACAADRASSADARDLAAALDLTLFEEAGFRGDVISYYDPRNSFLNDVLERRTGIPITLSVVYVETGRRLGLDLYGIPFPGHFLVGLRAGGAAEVVDVFNRGARLTRETIAEMLAAAGVSQALADAHLAPATHRQILVRMLTNLKHIYLQKGDFARTAAVIERILQLAPDSSTERRDLGLVLLQLGETARALEELEAYKEVADDGDDARFVRSAIANARRELARLN